MWISNAGFADLFIVFAKIEQDDKLSAFIVEKEFGGIILGEEEKKLGIKGSSTRQVFFEDCPVPMENLLGKRNEGFKIALIHSPELYDLAAECGFSLYLAGHTHGGQIALPGGKVLYKNARCPVRLASGNWQYGSLKGYTSVGAGSSLLDVRFNCRPEVVLHRLHCP